MQSFISELRRRNVLRVAAFYAAAAWLLVQIATQVFPFFDIPNGVVRLIVVAVIVGFPCALALSWFYELTPQGLKLESEIARDPSIVRSSGRRLDRWIIVILLLAVVLLLADKLVFRRSGEPAVAEVAASERSIAVLPFENLSDDKANGYFVHGMQDEILTRLAKIGALKVISRTSTSHYGSSPDNLLQIARQLGVANILEGSVQKAGDKVHVNVQLIKAATAEHLWADSYDRRLDDVFAVEGEVAGAIAQALQARLSGGERQAIAAKSTDNPAAYDAYLRGLGDEMRALVSFAPESLRQSERDYAEAVRLDPAFALAWARLAIVKSYLYVNLIDRSAELLAQAKDAADTALRLQPEMGEAYLAQGYYHYRGLRDFDGGLRFFNQALQRLPNNADALAAIGYIERRQGKWPESTEHLEQASRLDPRNTAVLSGLTLNYSYLRQYPQALEVYDRALAVTPQDAELIGGKAGVYQQAGNLDAADKLLDPLPFKLESPRAAQARIDQFLYRRRYPEAIAALTAATEQSAPGADRIRANLYFLLGLTQIWAGHPEAAHAPCLRALEMLKGLRKSDADDAELGVEFASAYGCLGDWAAALRFAHLALDLKAGDAVDRPNAEIILVIVQAWAGDHDAALAALPRLLQEPGGVTPANLRLQPAWDSLRQDPRFLKLLADGDAANQGKDRKP